MALDAAVKRLFTGGRSPQQEMLRAVSSEDPDERRAAVARVASSRKYREEWAIKGFVAIALLESEPQVRCVAIRALARVDDPRAPETMLKILNHEDYPPREVWPPTPVVRWDATEALAELAERNVPDETQRTQVLDTFIERLTVDTDRHARMAAAKGLRYFQDLVAVRALIAGLRDDDFAVVHACEASLVHLTGRTHHGSDLAWEEWLTANQDAPFAHAGEIPPSREPLYTTRWGKAMYDTKEVVDFLWPGSDD